MWIFKNKKLISKNRKAIEKLTKISIVYKCFQIYKNFEEKENGKLSPETFGQQ